MFLAGAFSSHIAYFMVIGVFYVVFFNFKSQKLESGESFAFCENKVYEYSVQSFEKKIFISVFDIENKKESTFSKHFFFRIKPKIYLFFQPDKLSNFSNFSRPPPFFVNKSVVFD